jgi:hypothetical protein
MPYVDFQSFFSVLTQISPELDTFGWKILVANQPAATNQLGGSTMCEERRRTLRRGCWELLGELKLHPEVSSSIRGTL